MDDGGPGDWAQLRSDLGLEGRDGRRLEFFFEKKFFFVLFGEHKELWKSRISPSRPLSSSTKSTLRQENTSARRKRRRKERERETKKRERSALSSLSRAQPLFFSLFFPLESGLSFFLFSLERQLLRWLAQLAGVARWRRSLAR